MVMSSSKSEVSRTCEDCGNKAKRDCKHKRCRSCCKSRGFPCPTHVRSTWVPVARRRQLLHQRLSLSAASSAHPLHLITSPSSSSSGFQGRNHSFPVELNSVANFRGVRVISDDNAVDQAAYQASVNIGGHVFSGILYDQGPSSPSGGENTSTDQLHIHQLVGMSTATTHPSGDVGGSSGGAMLPCLNYPHHPYPVYPSNAPFILPGMQFFPHPKP